MKRLYVELVAEDKSILLYDKDIDIFTLDYEVKKILLNTASGYQILYENMMESKKHDYIYLCGVEIDIPVIIDALLQVEAPAVKTLCEEHLELMVVDDIVLELVIEGISELVGENKLIFRLTESKS